MKKAYFIVILVQKYNIKKQKNLDPDKKTTFNCKEKCFDFVITF